MRAYSLQGRITRWLKGTKPVRPRRAPRARGLGFETLESRSLLTANPVVGPLPFGIHGLSLSQVPATTSPSPPSAADLAAETTAADSSNQFGLDLYAQLQAAAGGSGNMFVSPFSISTALAMAYAGAAGNTAAQMASVLHLTGSQSTTAEDFGKLLSDLNSAGQNDYALSVADALWGQQGAPFLANFLATLANDYASGMNQVDFANQAEAARQTINSWVAQHTDNKITDLIPQGELNQLTRFVLTNAIYFKGDWATQFNPALTQNANFTLASGSSELVPMMNNTTGYHYMQSDGYQVLELPYAGGRLAMDVLLPTAAGSAALSVSNLPSNLNSWLDGLAMRSVDVSLPKFTLSTQVDLSGPLQALGMTDAFNRYAANFSGIIDPQVAPLYIGDVLHQAYVGVDESGTEAVGATAVIGMQALVVMGNPPPPVVFNADHPFLFLIRDTQSGSVLFMGQEADPLSTSGDPTAPGIKAQSPIRQPSRLPTGEPTGPIVPVWISNRSVGVGTIVNVGQDNIANAQGLAAVVSTTPATTSSAVAPSSTGSSSTLEESPPGAISDSTTILSETDSVVTAALSSDVLSPAEAIVSEMSLSAKPVVSSINSLN